MSEIIAVGLDLAKNVFQVQGSDGSGSAAQEAEAGSGAGALRPPAARHCRHEACSGDHFWGREIGEPGHEVRLIPPAYVKPFVKRQKHDTADAEAICEAAMRPTMRFVPAKSEETQGAAIGFFLHRRSESAPLRGQ